MEQYRYIHVGKKVQDHNLRLKSSLRMGFVYLMDTHKITLFKKKEKKNIKT